MKRLLATAAVLLPAAAAAQIPAPNAQDLSGTRALAMGDAFRAVASSNEAIYFNLAGMALAPRYELDLHYAFNNANDLDLYNGSIVDAKSTSVATGLAYSRLVADGLNGHLVHLGFGLPLAQRVAIGFGFKYLNFSEPEDNNSITGDLGLLIRPIEILSIGFAAYNLVDVRSVEAPRRGAVGVAVGTDSAFRVAADATFDLSDQESGSSYHAGAEYLLDGAFPLRAGFKRLQETDRNYVSGGVGFISPEAGLEVAYVQNIGEGEGEDRTFSFTLKLFL